MKAFMYNTAPRMKLEIKLSPGHIFFTGDVVEVLNVSKSQVDSIQSQTCSNDNPVPHIVGNKYRLFVSTDRESKIRFSDIEEWNKNYYDPTMWRGQLQYRLNGWYHGGLTADRVESDQIILYKRPLKNWLKYWYLLITKNYLG